MHDPNLAGSMTHGFMGTNNNPFDLLAIRRSCIPTCLEWEKSSSRFGKGNLKSSGIFMN